MKLVIDSLKTEEIFLSECCHCTLLSNTVMARRSCKMDSLDSNSIHCLKDFKTQSIYLESTLGVRLKSILRWRSQTNSSLQVCQIIFHGSHSTIHGRCEGIIAQENYHETYQVLFKPRFRTSRFSFYISVKNSLFILH